jgi:hypothetical protein
VLAVSVTITGVCIYIYSASSYCDNKDNNV